MTEPRQPKGEIVLFKSAQERHDNLVDILSDTLKSQGHYPTRNVIQSDGTSLDVMCAGVYYNVKSIYNERNIKAGYMEISKAIENKWCAYGYLVTPEGLFDIMKPSNANKLRWILKLSKHDYDDRK
jgi:hypothetical protein